MIMNYQLLFYSIATERLLGTSNGTGLNSAVA